MVERYDFLAVVKTWSTPQSNINLKGYPIFSQHGIKLAKKKGRRSGGVVFYNKHKYKHGIKLMSSSNKFCMWVKFDSNVFSLDQDLFLCIVYIRPTRADIRDQYFEQIASHIMKYKNSGEVMLSGDFNSRTGTLLDFIQHDDGASEYVALPSNYGTFSDKRNNMAKVVNDYGEALLELCCNSCLRILNGRTCGDSLGHMTYFSTDGKGSSCVDYTLVGNALMEKIKYFGICEPNRMLSDHCLMRFGIRCAFEEKLDDSQVLKPLYDKFEMSENCKEKYQMELLEHEIQDKICNFIFNDYPNKYQDTVDNAVNDFTDIMVSAGKLSFKLIKESRKKKPTDFKRKKPGFDSDCYKLRKEVRSLGRALHRNPFNQYLREKFMSNSRKYKNMLKQKDKEIHNKLVNNLCTAESKNPKYFWQLVDKMKSKKM